MEKTASRQIAVKESVGGVVKTRQSLFKFEIASTRVLTQENSCIIPKTGPVVANVHDSLLRLLDQAPETGFSSMLLFDPVQEKIMGFEFGLIAYLCSQA